MNDQEQAGIAATNGLSAATTGYLDTAGGLANASTAAVNPTAVDGAAISKYESPYQSDVISATMAEIANQNAQQREGQTSSAISAGAFGGDRAGVAQAALANQQDLASNATLANLNNQNYSQALNEANTQQQTSLSADQANRAALQTGSQLYSGLGSLASSTGIANAQAQLEGGLVEQQTQQAADTANYGQFENAQAYPFQTAQFLAGITGSLAPSLGTSSTGTSVTSPPNPLNSIVGGGLGLASLLSDRRAKEDIKPIGKDFTGQMLYSFRYKGQAETHVGYIAQEIEKKHPDAVDRREDGMRVVDYAEASRKAAEKGHFARGGRTLDEQGLGQVRRYATGGVPGMPYADATGYVPTIGLAAAARAPQSGPSQGMAGSPTSSTTDALPDFSSYIQAGKGLSNTSFGDAVSDFTQDNLGFANGGLARATGGKVVDLGLARARRGYDGGGVVSDPNAMMFDPSAFGDPSALGGIQPGLGAAASPGTMTPPTAPPALPGLPSDPPTGLGAAAVTPVPVAPAPTVTPVIGYKNADGSVAPAPGLAAAATSPAASDGLGAIEKAAPSSPTSMDGYYGRVRAMESGGDNTATSPAGAAGAYQIMPNTWNGLMQQHPELGLTPDGIRNPQQQEAAVRALTSDNAAALKSALGRDPTAAELYLAHQQGAGGAISMLTNPAARAGDLVGDKAVSMNGGDPNMKAGDFANMWMGKFNGATPATAMAYAGGPTGSPPPPPIGLGAASTSGPSSFSDNFGSMIGGTGKPTADHSGGLLGLFPGMSDNARLGLAAAGFGMAASGSRSVGQAIGQGGLAGIQQYQASGLAQAQIANAKSEIANRAGVLGIEGRKQNLAETQAKRLWDATDAIAKELRANGSLGGPSGVSPSSAQVQPQPQPQSSRPQAGVPATVSPQAVPTTSVAAPAFDWSRVAPESNPAMLDAKAAMYERASNAGVQSPEQSAMYSKMALQYRNSAAQIRQSGKVTMTDGSVVLAPGYANTEATIEGAKANARASTEAGYRVREQEPTPGAPSTYTTDAQIVKGLGSGLGAGSPPGSAAGQPPAIIAKQPAFYAAKQDMIAKNETEMVGQFQARQVARQRLQDLQSILQNYQTGAFSEEKSDLAAKLSAAGIPVSTGALDNAQKFQKFTKDATANLFDNVKTMGGRVLVSEIEGLKNANANADLQPAANAAIIGQGIGLLNYEDKHTNDYFAWKQQNPNATDTSTFELPWAKANPVAPFVNDARLGTAAKGIAIPAAGDRVQGQAYMTPKGKAVWTGSGWRLAQ